MPNDDIGRLREYISDRFHEQRKSIGKLGYLVQENPTPLAVLELSAQAVAFRHELVSWQAFAQRLYDESHASCLISLRTETDLGSEDHKSKKISIRETELIVKGQIAPLKQALDLIGLTADQLKNVIFWSQAMARILPLDEHTEGQVSAAEYDENVFLFPPVGSEAPIEEALRRLEKPSINTADRLVLEMNGFVLDSGN